MDHVNQEDLQSSLDYEYETKCFSSSRIHSVSVSYDLDR